MTIDTMQAPKWLAQGFSDFELLRQQQRCYVDKSLFILKILQDSAQTILIPRPRRFGKTLNLSMLRYFFENTKDTSAQQARRALFNGLEIEKNEMAMAHFGQYSVVFISFKDLKNHVNFDSAYVQIQQLLSDVYQEHRHLLTAHTLTQEDRTYYQAVLSQTLPAQRLCYAIQHLCAYLKRVYQKPVILLIDEYDTPMHDAYLQNYIDPSMGFFRNLLSAVLKDNRDIFRAVMTGIMRVAKESIFSGLNNLGVYSFLDPTYATDFGFTNKEVQLLTKQLNCEQEEKEIARWYNGYNFSGQTIYNPWSVISCLSHPHYEKKTYWANTASTGLIEHALFNNTLDVKDDLQKLLQDGTLERKICEHITLNDLSVDPDMIWNLLLFSGYLKVVRTFCVDTTDMYAELKIPNLELHAHLKGLASTWFRKLVSNHVHVDVLLRAFLSGSEQEITKYLQDILSKHISFFDTKESFFHGLILGLLVHLSGRYTVISNPESGFGRCDVLITPKNPQDVGIVIEFKVVHKEFKETAKMALDTAMEQIKTRDYTATLRNQGVGRIRLLALAFLGKKVFTRIEYV